jgi:hypothetical protein
MLQPLKLATPPVVVDVQPERVPDPEAMAKVTAFESAVTVLPPASLIVTTGWLTNALPPTAFSGWVVKTSCAAGPVPTVKAELVALARFPSLATSL